MYIEKIMIKSFGGLREREFMLSPGVNIFEGENESGKTTVAAAIKFVLYGLPQKVTDGTTLTERRKYLSWDGSPASVSLVLSAGGRRILAERHLSVSTDASGKESYRETIRMTDMETNEQIYRGKNPGEVLLGVPEDVFLGTAFVKQTDGARIDGRGMAEAAENLLFSADETVNTQLALDKIDAERRALRHKNGRGGAIVEKQRERDALMASLDEAKSSSAELIYLDGSIADLTEKRDVAIKRRDAARAKYEAYEASVAVRRFDALHEVEKKLDVLYSEKDALLERGCKNNHFPDSEYVAKLRSLSDALDSAAANVAQASRTLNDRRAAVDALRAHDPSLKNQRSGDGNISDKNVDIKQLYAAVSTEKARDEIVRAAKSHKNRALIASILAGILFVGSLALAAAILLINIRYFPLYITSVAQFAVGILCSVIAARSGRRYRRVCATYGARNLKMLPDALSEYADFAELDAQRRNAVIIAEGIYHDACAEYDKLASEAAALISVRAPIAEGANIREELSATLRECEEIVETEKRVSEDIERYKSTAEELRRSLAGADEAALRAIVGDSPMPELDSAAISAMKLEREFNENAVTLLTENIHKLEVRRAQLAASAADPSQLAVRLEALNAEIEADTLRHDAYVLAHSMLEAAGEGVRAGVAPRLTKYAREYMGELTGGKYDALGVDASLGVTMAADGGTRELDFFSAGTTELAYISLRLALIRVLYRRETPPIIFDESFASIDDERAKRILLMLLRASKESINIEGGTIQSLIFTCQRREAKLAQDHLQEGFCIIRM